MAENNRTNQENQQQAQQGTPINANIPQQKGKVLKPEELREIQRRPLSASEQERSSQWQAGPQVGQPVQHSSSIQSGQPFLPATQQIQQITRNNMHQQARPLIQQHTQTKPGFFARIGSAITNWWNNLLNKKPEHPLVQPNQSQSRQHIYRTNSQSANQAVTRQPGANQAPNNPRRIMTGTIAHTNPQQATTRLYTARLYMDRLSGQIYKVWHPQQFTSGLPVNHLAVRINQLQHYYQRGFTPILSAAQILQNHQTQPRQVIFSDDYPPAEPLVVNAPWITGSPVSPTHGVHFPAGAQWPSPTDGAHHGHSDRSTPRPS